jgi:carbon-monoxide dehydrogenase small subunit
MTNSINVHFILNNRPVSAVATPGMNLLSLLKSLGVNSVKQACVRGECGACTVIVDGDAMNACLILAGTICGRRVTTLEGIGGISDMHPLQVAFAELGASQCGFCTPGFIVSAKALLDKNPAPTVGEIRYGLSGNLCRCTGYAGPVKAVEIAAECMEAGDDAVDAVRQAVKVMLARRR